MDRQNTTAEPVRITSLQAENVKRVKAVSVVPLSTGLTVIGGRNGQGKTSVLDAIAWALGGDRFKPSAPEREGSVTPPSLHVELSNGLVVERAGKNSDLKVIDPSGNKAGQTLLNSFIETLALDLPRFLALSEKDKAKVLLDIIGVGDDLFDLQKSERDAYEKRLVIGRMRDTKQGAADDMPTYPDAPDEPVSATELILQQQEILARNGENQKKREQVTTIMSLLYAAKQDVDRLETQLAEAKKKKIRLESDLAIAQKTAAELTYESTAEIEDSLAAIDMTNEKVRTNQARATAQAEADALKEEYQQLSNLIDEIRDEQTALLDGANLPLEGLGVTDGEITYNGRRWDSMASSEQLRVATAIVRRLRPECGFVLLDKLEQFDVDTLAQFGQWACDEGMQIIGTRVSTGGECQIVIEDGYGTMSNTTSTWKAGEF
ncbi:MAG: AAA family ATPase [Coriobacteriales bacterium]|jgi:hypothetical protein|nr:AAA family ATPase [Coriobacteriales bacterium]